LVTEDQGGSDRTTGAKRCQIRPLSGFLMLDETPSPRRSTTLPSSLPPRGLSRVQAAEYIGVSPSTFDKMVTDGEMPAPKGQRPRDFRS